MLGSLANAWKVPELRQRLLFTAMILALYRLGAYVPLPGISPEVLGGAGTARKKALGGVLFSFSRGGP